MSHRMRLGAISFSSIGLLMMFTASFPAQEQGYRMPPAEIAALVDAPMTPAVLLSPHRNWMLLLDIPALPPLSELAQPELSLAGERINPGTFAPSRSSYFSGMLLKKTTEPPEFSIAGLPDQPRLRDVKWSPDGRRIAFTFAGVHGISLWCLEVATRQAVPLVERLNACFPGAPYEWMPDSQGLLCRQIPENYPPAPVSDATPTRPIIQENHGKIAPARTYQDLLKSPHDEALFEHYFTLQLVLVSLDGQKRSLGSPGLHRTAEPSPDGQYILVETLHRPFSYLVPMNRFPHAVQVWDKDGKVIKSLADLPLAEEVPIARDAVPAGARDFAWRHDAAATLCWCEAQDGGDPKIDVAVRDKVWTLPAPFNRDPQLLINLTRRYSGIFWGTGTTALVSERWWDTRQIRVWRVRPDVPGAAVNLVWERSWEERYGDPGVPVLTTNASGRPLLRFAGNTGRIFLRGMGASPQGDFPFLDEYDLGSGKSTRLWQCAAPYYEYFIDFLDDDNRHYLTRRESLQEPPNYYIHKGRDATVHAVTSFPHPYPQLEKVQKELIHYLREDGVSLSGTLYTPAGWQREQGPLPVLFWAYPQEYKSAAAAGQVKDSPYRFVRLSSHSPLFWLVRGYAILDNPAMPIIGENDEEPNDTYIEQLVASARSAIAELQRRGVADSNRIAIGGHSYGAFMTANLLSHSDLFRAGIARSGAYNRTLTPFGFQSEERTLWDAPDVYARMSPFMFVRQMNTPLLLMHGEADNNSGTFPMQSERYYAALKGMGKTVRLVILPCESHGYRARESVLHMLWEMDQWLEKHVASDQ